MADRTEPVKTSAPPDAKKPWNPPTVRLLGTIRELVQGGTKTGSAVDGDPFSARRRGNV